MSLTLTNDPSGLARTTMAPNSSTVVSRPLVWMLSWNCWSGSAGCAPMRPTAAWMFCRLMALAMSFGVSLKLVMRSVLSQIVML